MTDRQKPAAQAEVDVYTAIAHPVRRQILHMLVHDDLSVNALADPFAVSRSAISQHLKILLDSGLVEQQKRGRERYYHLRPENLNEVRRWLDHFSQFWEARLDALGTYLDDTADQQESDPPDAAQPDV